MTRGSKTAMWIAAVVTILVGIALVRTVIEGGALGHDESVYAVKARSWIADTPATGWGLHRAPLLSILITPIVAVTESEVALRSVGVVLAMASLVVLYLLTRRLEDGWAALVAVAVVGASFTFQRRGSELLTDAAATGLLLAIALLLVATIQDSGSRGWRIIWVGPLAAAAFYMRYPSALAVLAMVLFFCVVAPRIALAVRWPLAVAAGSGFVLLLPHFIWATRVAGSPWGVLTIATGAGNRAYLGEGLADYAAMFPVELAGPAGAVLMAIGVAWSVWALWTKAGEGRVEARIAGFTLGVVAMIVIPLGLVVHGEARYVLFPSWLLIALGALALVRVVHRIVESRVQLGILIVALALWVPMFVITANYADRYGEFRAGELRVLVEAADRIEAEAEGTCGVLTGYRPQVTWYSRCRSMPFRPDQPELGVFTLRTDSRFALFFENGRRQPTPDQVPAYLALGPSQLVTSESGPLGDAVIVSINEG